MERTEPGATSDPLDGIECPACSCADLYSPVNGFSACWCRQCGAHLALHTVIDPGRPGGLTIQVTGIRGAPASHRGVA